LKQSVISAKNLSIGYPKTSNHGSNELYKELSFNLYEGELTCLLGLNGAGKSTLLRTLSSMQPVLDGNINLNSKPLGAYKEDELSRILGLVLTDKTSVGGLTVSQLVALGRYPYTGFFGRLTNEDHLIVEKAIEDVGISYKSKSYMAELSDGERQKAMIAKVLAQECPILLLDEPTAFLDVASRIEIMNLLHTLASSHKKTILLSTHDIELAFLLSDRLWLLSREKGLKCGVTEDIILNNDIETFFGRDGISFDKQSGNFIPAQRTKEKVLLNAGKEQFMWAHNFLRRNGFGLTQNESEAIFKLDISTDNSLKITRNKNTLSLNSFEELLGKIKHI